jgi:hypothetical protein
MNIMAKQDGQATAASFDSQYRHCGESDETAAPQLGQLRVCASITIWRPRISPTVSGFAGIPACRKMYHLKAKIYHGIRWTNSCRCAMLTLQISRVTQQAFAWSSRSLGVPCLAMGFLCNFGSLPEHFCRKDGNGADKTQCRLET